MSQTTSTIYTPPRRRRYSADTPSLTPNDPLAPGSSQNSESSTSMMPAPAPAPRSTLPPAQVRANQSRTLAAKAGDEYRTAEFAENAPTEHTVDTPEAAAARKSKMDLTQQQAKAIFDSSKTLYPDPETHFGKFVGKLGEYGIDPTTARMMADQFAGKTSTPTLANQNIPLIPINRETGQGGMYSTPDRGVVTINADGGVAGGKFAPPVDDVPRRWNPNDSTPSPTPNPAPLPGYDVIPKAYNQMAVTGDDPLAVPRPPAAPAQPQSIPMTAQEMASRQSYVQSHRAQGDAIATVANEVANPPTSFPLTAAEYLQQQKLAQDQTHEERMSQQTAANNAARQTTDRNREDGLTRRADQGRRLDAAKAIMAKKYGTTVEEALQQADAALGLTGSPTTRPSTVDNGADTGLPAGATPTRLATGRAAEISTPEQYKALPVGTEFMWKGQRLIKGQ